MKKKHGLMQDLLLDAAIALLVSTAVGLAATVWAQSLGMTYPWELLPQESVELPSAYAAYEELSPAIDLVQPLRCAVQTERGTSPAVSADRTEAKLRFAESSALLTEAMETGEEVSTAVWTQMPEQMFLYWDFGGTVPASLLCRTLGVEHSYDGSFRFLILSGEGERTTLFFMQENGEGRLFHTAVTVESLQNACVDQVEALTDTGFFQGINLYGSRHVYPVVKRDNALQTDYERTLTQCLQSFDFNTFSASLYRDNDGTLVYVQEASTLRIREGEGTLRYASGLENSRSVGLTAQEEALVIGRASRIAGALLSGSEGMYLMEAGYLNESGLYQVLIGMECGGVRILTDTGYAARFLFRGTELFAAEISLMRYLQTDASDTVLPAVQAEAAASLRDYAVYYAEEEEQLLHPGWYGKSKD